MHRIGLAALIIVGVTATGLGALRVQDIFGTGRTWHSVAEEARTRAASGGTYDTSMITDLPEPVQRYFGFTLTDGTTIPTGVKIGMTGTIAPNGGADAMPMMMSANEVIALPNGFVSCIETQEGPRRFSGTDALIDGVSWSRFWTFAIVPVGRAGGSEDHWKASFGRMVAEAAFWSPASLLPREGIVWSAPDPSIARATVTHRGFSQSVDITLREDGAPVRVEIDRWAERDGAFGWRPFGGTMSDFAAFGGITVPRRVEGGYDIGTPDYVPSFTAEVVALDWLEAIR